MAGRVGVAGFASSTIGCPGCCLGGTSREGGDVRRRKEHFFFRGRGLFSSFFFVELSGVKFWWLN